MIIQPQDPLRRRNSSGPGGGNVPGGGLSGPQTPGGMPLPPRATGGISGPVHPGGGGNVPLSGPQTLSGPTNLPPGGPAVGTGGPVYGDPKGGLTATGMNQGDTGGSFEDAVLRKVAGPVPGNTGIAGPTEGYSGPAATTNAAPAQGSAFDAERFRTGWAHGGSGFGSQTNIGELQKYIADDPSFAGVTLKGEKVYDPQGRFMFDAIGNYTGGDPKGMTRIALQGNSPYQKGGTPKGTNGLSGPQNPGGPTNLPPGTGGGGGAGGGTGPGFNTSVNGQSNTLLDLLMKRAGASETVDPNDPIIQAQTDAFRGEGVQARRDFLSAQAEGAGPYGNQRSEERRSAEELGKSVGGFRAQAMQQELSAKRAQIEHALSGAAGFITEQQRMQLQNQLTRLQLAQQESQFGRNLKQQGSQFDRNLSMQKDQFGRTIGQRAYEFDTGRYDNLFL